MLNDSELYQMISSREKSWRLEKTIGLKDATKYGKAICSIANDLPYLGIPGYLPIILDKNKRIVGMKLGAFKVELQKYANPAPEFITNLPGKFVVKVWAKK